MAELAPVAFALGAAAAERAGLQPVGPQLGVLQLGVLARRGRTQTVVAARPVT